MLDGAVYCTRAVIESMVDEQVRADRLLHRRGRVRGRLQDAPHVSAAKMGLVGLARGLASEFAAQNIRVNVVSPGSIDTSRANPEWYQGRAPNAAGIPLGRQGTVGRDRRHLPVPRQRRRRLHHGPDHPRQRRRRVAYY